MNSILLFKQDLEKYPTNSLQTLQRYFELPTATRDDLLWLLAIHQAQNNRQGTMRGATAPMTDKYDILETLGEGAYGVVYRVKVKGDFDTPKHSFKIGEEYAMKVFRENDEGIGGDAIREVDILNRLDQENVIFAYDTFGTRDSAGVCNEIRTVLPLALGDLHHYIAQELAATPSGEPLAPLKMFFDILCGVYYLHSNFIIHDDLKPENILIFDRQGRTGIGKWEITTSRSTGETYYYDPRRNHISQFEKPIDRDFDLQPRIADYGLSNFAVGVKDIGGISQSRWWRPPELLKPESHKRHSYESDMWALGVVFYELATGENPFAADLEGEVLEKIRKFAKSQTWMDLPQFKGDLDGLQYLIEKMLNLDPVSRITAEDALKDPVFAAFDCPQKRIETIPWDMDSSITDRERTEMTEYINNKVDDMRLNARRVRWLGDPEEFDRVELLSIDIFDRSVSDRAACAKDKGEHKTAASASVVLAAKIFNIEEFLDDKDLFNENLNNMQCRIMRCLDWTPFRPPISLLFPDTDTSELKKCYRKFRSPDEIRACVDEYERQQQIRRDYKPSGISREYVNKITGQTLTLDVSEKALERFKLKVDQQILLKRQQTEATVLGVIDGELYVTYIDDYGDEDIGTFRGIYDTKGLEEKMTPL